MQDTINQQIEIYTDGSCHTQICIGAWASIILIGNEKINLSGVVENTTHNRMEILAVIKALDYFIKEINNDFDKITIVSDGEDRVIFKNDDEHTSPILNTYKSENCYIVVTENTIYIISSETQVR